jgi:RNA polymerase sigma factor (sigma-70 family)
MYESTNPRNLLRQVQVLFSNGTAVGLSDRDLLERFLHQGRESSDAAFAALVERHGPMVLRVCRHALGDMHAAEDAFQATFIVLAQRARSIRHRDSLESWLFGVATRAAAHIRMAASRRQRYEQRGAVVRARAARVVPAAQESWPELHAEIARLPEKHRVPILLCYFEGLTHEQAADRLGWPVGTVKTRLARGREQLRCRLERRVWSSGLAPVAAFLRPWAAASVPWRLVELTSRAAARFASGPCASEIVSSSVLTIAQGVSKLMLINQMKVAAIGLLAVSAIGLGTLALAWQGPGPRGDGRTEPRARGTNEPSRPTILDLVGATSVAMENCISIQFPFDSRVDKIHVDLGSRVSPGDPLLELSSEVLAEAKSNYELATGEWDHDKKMLDYKQPLASANQITRKELIEVENALAQSRLKMKLAKDKLLLYGLTEKEIAQALNEGGAQKARMVPRSRVAGVVIERTAVPGSYYTSRDTLLVIADLDTLLVIANVDSRDAEQLVAGQRVTVKFPFGDRTEDARVEAINWENAPVTGKVTVRTSIPNRDHRLKPGMMVQLAVNLGTAVTSRGGESAVATEDQSSLGVERRLHEVERKLERTLERLLDEKGARSPNEEILRRLNELERKLDRVLNLRSAH